MGPQRNSSLVFWVFALSIFIALVLTVLPVPQVVFYFWPDWIPLVMFYWALTDSERIGPWVGFAVGTLMEVVFVRSFGVLGLGMATMVFAVNRIHLQLRVLSVWQQMLVVGIFIGIFKLITGWIYGMISGFTLNAEDFYSLIGGMVTWPFLFILLQELRRSTRLN